MFRLFVLTRPEVGIGDPYAPPTYTNREFVGCHTKWAYE